MKFGVIDFVTGIHVFFIRQNIVLLMKQCNLSIASKCREWLNESERCVFFFVVENYEKCG